MNPLPRPWQFSHDSLRSGSRWIRARIPSANGGIARPEIIFKSFSLAASLESGYYITFSVVIFIQFLPDAIR